MSIARLLTVVEVPKDRRVVCQASGCGHGVYKRIHVVQDGDQMMILGADCFMRLYGHLGLNRMKPTYGSSDGRKLTEEERKLLSENTQNLIDLLQEEHVTNEQRIALERASEVQKAQNQGDVVQENRNCISHDLVPRKIRLRYDDWLQQLTPSQRQRFEIIRQHFREEIRNDLGVDPDIPGNVGMVNLKARSKFEAEMKGWAG